MVDIPNPMPDDDAAPDGGGAGPAPFRVVLYPHRSLPPAGFLALMGVLALVSFAAGMVFMAMGAWPVFGFFGLDLALIWLAFHSNYRAGRIREALELDENGLSVTRIHPGGRHESWLFEPYWLRVEVEGDEETGAELRLVSHGRSVVLGAFLGHREKIEFAGVLRRALAAYGPA